MTQFHLKTFISRMNEKKKTHTNLDNIWMQVGREAWQEKAQSQKAPKCLQYWKLLHWIYVFHWKSEWCWAKHSNLNVAWGEMKDSNTIQIKYVYHSTRLRTLHYFAIARCLPIITNYLFLRWFFSSSSCFDARQNKIKTCVWRSR